MNQGHAEQENKIIAGSSYTKTIHVKSKVNEVWQGEVTFKLPAMKDLIQAGLKQAEMRGGLPPESFDAFTNHMARVTGDLSVVVTAAPSWWYREVIRNNKKELEPALDTILDPNMLLDIWEEYVAFRDTFPESNGASGDREATTEPGAVAGGENPGSQPLQS